MDDTRDTTYVKMGDAYFKRLIVPLVITLLFIAGLVVIVVAPPGTPREALRFVGGFLPSGVGNRPPHT